MFVHPFFENWLYFTLQHYIAVLYFTTRWKSFVTYNVDHQVMIHFIRLVAIKNPAHYIFQVNSCIDQDCYDCIPFHLCCCHWIASASTGSVYGMPGILKVADVVPVTASSWLDVHNGGYVPQFLINSYLVRTITMCINIGSKQYSTFSATTNLIGATLSLLHIICWLKHSLCTIVSIHSHSAQQFSTACRRMTEYP